MQLSAKESTRKDLAVEENVGTWLGLPITRFRGALADLGGVLPEFERRPFSVPSPPDRSGRASGLYDAIVCPPRSATDTEVPVGVVSRAYQLIQHRAILDRVSAALREASIAVESVSATMLITTHGERMALSVLFPDANRFRYDVGQGDSMRFRIECFNSVEGSTRLMVTAGWFRFVCRNGLVVGRPLAKVRAAHTPNLKFDDVGRSLRHAIGQVNEARTLCERWRGAVVHAEALRRWTDGPLKQAWGVKAAARAYRICLTGRDVVLTDPFERASPSERAGTEGARVPGSRSPSETAFDVAQALSWLADQKRDLASRLEATQEIPNLVNRLIKTGARNN